MLRKLILSTLLCLTVFQLQTLAQSAPAKDKDKSPAPKSAESTPAKPGTVEARVEAYLRNLYAWGPAFDVKVGPSKPSPIPELQELPVKFQWATNPTPP